MHYVCSDLHGRFDKYQEVLSKLKLGDKLFILGDVIDRYPDGIKILKDVITRENVMLFIGNHEDMMYKTMVEQDVSWTMTWLNPCNGGLQTFNNIQELISLIKVLGHTLSVAKMFCKIVPKNAELIAISSEILLI